MNKKKTLVKLLLFLGAFVETTSCTPTSTLYNWGDYGQVSYNYSKDPSEKNEEKLSKSFTNMISRPGGSRKVVPPGLLAEQAYLLVRQGKKDAAVEMLQDEIKQYPESKLFTEKIIKQVQQ